MARVSAQRKPRTSAPVHKNAKLLQNDAAAYGRQIGQRSSGRLGSEGLLTAAGMGARGWGLWSPNTCPLGTMSWEMGLKLSIAVPNAVFW